MVNSMTVTAISECSGNRCKIFIDEEFAFVLYKGELSLFQIALGEEVSEAACRQIRQEVLPKRAKLRLMNLLQNRRYTEKQLLDKLNQGGYAPEIATAALSYVKSYGYVDDRQYAIDYITYRMETQSQGKIRNDLWKKGLDRKLIDIIWEEVAGEMGEEKEKEQILHLLEKRKYDKNSADLQEKRRTFAYLYRKGFQIETIKQLLSLDIT